MQIFKKSIGKEFKNLNIAWSPLSFQRKINKIMIMILNLLGTVKPCLAF